MWGAADVANTRLARNKNVGVRIYRNILVFKIETKRYQSCITVLTRFIVRSPRGSFGSLVASRRTLFSLSTRSRNDVIRGFHTLVFEIIKSVSLYPCTLWFTSGHKEAKCMHGFQRIKRAIGDNWNGGNGQLLFHVLIFKRTRRTWRTLDSWPRFLDTPTIDDNQNIKCNSKPCNVS